MQRPSGQDVAKNERANEGAGSAIIIIFSFMLTLNIVIRTFISWNGYDYFEFSISSYGPVTGQLNKMLNISVCGVIILLGVWFFKVVLTKSRTQNNLAADPRKQMRSLARSEFSDISLPKKSLKNVV